MTTIVLNTANGAVTEYDWSFDSIGPTRAGSAAGLFTLGGDTDAGAPIAATFLSGKTLLGSMLRKAMGFVFVAMTAVGDAATLRVRGSADWTYPIAIDPKGVSRVRTGRGIDDNYLALGFSNVDGADFRVDAFELDLPTHTTRRN